MTDTCHRPTITRAVWVIYVVPHTALHMAAYARVFWDEALFRVRVDEMRDEIRATRSHALLYRVQVPENLTDEGLIEWVNEHIIEVDRPAFDPIETLS